MVARKKYTPEFREQAVREVLESSRPVADVAREFRVGTETLRVWVNRHKKANPEAGPGLSEPERVESAAVFVDACAPNYAHWLTEVLPRVALFCREERYAGIPLVVNDGLHRNLVESLRMITRGTRRIIMLPIGRAIVVSELFLTSVAG